MTNYQKAIKVRKTCENQNQCVGENECIYYKKCSKSVIILFSPMDDNISTIAKAIKQEKWNVK